MGRPGGGASAEAIPAKPLIVPAAAAMLGMAGPLALAVTAGYPGAGVAAAFGGLALSAIQEEAAFSERMSECVYTIIAGSLAMFFGCSLGGCGPVGGMAMLVVFVTAAVFSGISRPVGRAGIRFVLYSVIAANIAGRASVP